MSYTESFLKMSLCGVLYSVTLYNRLSANSLYTKGKKTPKLNSGFSVPQSKLLAGWIFPLHDLPVR
jgi:hypothetical protein